MVGRLQQSSFLEPITYTFQNGIRWPEIKTSGVTVRSQRTKLPISVGMKKTKAIECMLNELGIPVQPPATGEIIRFLFLFDY